MQEILEALPLEYQQLHEVVHTLAKLVLQSRLFPAGHPAIERALGPAYLQLTVLLERKRSVQLVFSGGALHCLNFEIDIKETDDKAVHLLREALGRHAIGEIEFLKDTTREELASFARLIASQPCGAAGADCVSIGAEVRNIRVRGAVAPQEIAPNRALIPTGAGLVEYRAPGRTCSGASGGKTGLAIRGILDRLEKIRSQEGSNAGATIMSVIERESRGTATILLLNSLREFDEYTFGHSVNVAVITAAIARTLGFPQDFIDGIAHAALLHDMGKLYVPPEIINKTGRLTPSEWQAMKRHPIDGERILREEGLPLLCRRVAYEHHMRHDLKGYPSAKEGFAVHNGSEIVRIADSYDALTTRRPYRSQLNPYEAIKLMAKGSGTEFHREYFSAFLRILGNIPIGSLLRLTTGETAVVVGFSESNSDLPRVRLVTDASGKRIEGHAIVDLSDIDPATGKTRHQISTILDNPTRNVEIGKYVID